MRRTDLLLALALMLSATLLVGCGSATVSADYTDPFAYCEAAGTIDAPGEEYTGPALPETVARGLQTALNAPDLPFEMLQNGSVWRCVEGQVYACFVGANLPCEAKVNLDKTPTQEMTDFCTANPDSDFVPAVVTGRETVYEWRCTNSTPEIVRQVSEPDAQGFFSEIWYEISQE